MGSDDLCVNRAAPYKCGMANKPISSVSAGKRTAAADPDARETFSAQTPLVVIGLAAISMILLINSHARPTTPREKVVEYACSDCGTVVSVQRAANSAGTFSIQVQMLDGSIRTVELTTGFKVGDIVRVNGNALTLRSTAS